MKIAKADLVPTDHNLREQYADWQALEQACQQFMADVNTRPHRSTRQPPVFLLAQEHEHLHRLPAAAAHVVLRADPQGRSPATVSSVDAIYSVPHELIGERVWARADGEQLVAVHIDPDQGPREVARHRLTTPGRPSIQDEHYPPRPAGALERKPRARNGEEREFLAIGDGAERWLKRAAAEGTQRIRRKMAEAVDLAKLHGTGPVNDALARVRQLRPVRRRRPGQHPRPPAVSDRDPAPAARPGGPLAAALDPQLGGIRTMNARILPLARVIAALRAVLRPCAIVPRPIPCPQTSSATTIEDQR